ncbi:MULTISPECIES: ATP-grasp domain-containing protein [unclassified Serratia (in: enterobacteria)]|uniref:ATP-grasp domain-containing protein n=1 Tax=unclassified Serratia (in: enterobacteria) TaxID=2647522 RepID=UPI0030767BDD
MIKYVFLVRVPPRAFPNPYHEWFPELMPESALIIHAGRFDLWGIGDSYQEELRSKYAKCYFLKDYDSTGELERIVIDLNSIHPLQAIIAQSEFDILRAARLRKYLSIPGLWSDAAVLFRDKLIMKQVVGQLGLRVPCSAQAASYTDIYEFARHHGFPIVVKPRLGAGSIGVQVIHDEVELETFATTRFLHSLDDVSFLIVEKFVTGEMLHVDGIVQNGRVAFAVPSRYINGCLAFQDGDFVGSVMLDRDSLAYARAQAYVNKLVVGLPFPAIASFHIELFELPNGDISLCEIAIRTGGARIRDTIKLITGFDLDRYVAAVECGLPSELPSNVSNNLAGFGLIPPRRGRLLHAPTSITVEGLVQFQLTRMDLPQEFNAANASIDNICSFIVRGGSETEVKNRVYEVANTVSAKLDWQELEEGTAP